MDFKMQDNEYRDFLNRFEQIANPSKGTGNLDPEKLSLLLPRITNDLFLRVAPERVKIFRLLLLSIYQIDPPLPFVPSRKKLGLNFLASNLALASIEAQLYDSILEEQCKNHDISIFAELIHNHFGSFTTNNPLYQKIKHELYLIYCDESARISELEPTVALENFTYPVWQNLWEFIFMDIIDKSPKLNARNTLLLTESGEHTLNIVHANDQRNLRKYLIELQPNPINKEPYKRKSKKNSINQINAPVVLKNQRPPKSAKANNQSYKTEVVRSANKIQYENKTLAIKPDYIDPKIHVKPSDFSTKQTSTSKQRETQRIAESNTTLTKADCEHSSEDNQKVDDSLTPKRFVFLVLVGLFIIYKMYFE